MRDVLIVVGEGLIVGGMCMNVNTRLATLPPGTVFPV